MRFDVNVRLLSQLARVFRRRLAMLGTVAFFAIGIFFKRRKA